MHAIIIKMSELPRFSDKRKALAAVVLSVFSPSCGEDPDFHRS